VQVGSWWLLVVVGGAYLGASVGLVCGFVESSVAWKIIMCDRLGVSWYVFVVVGKERV
jgi:hypothetical protein